MAAPVDLTQRRVAPLFVERIPIHFARRHGLLGLESADAGVIEIAAGDPAVQSIVDNLGLTLECETRLLLADPEALQRAIDRAYSQQPLDMQGALATLPDAAEDVAVEADRFAGVGSDLLDSTTRAPVVKLVNVLLFDAVRRRASDVHVQPDERGLTIRLRIDGVLQDHLSPGTHLHEEMIARIKVMTGLDIAEKRLPQDGRATVRIGSRLIDLRVSIIPTAYGERAVLRLLDKGARLYDLGALGMAQDVLAQVECLIQRAHGMILLTGPTGSGKSTTLYAMLQRLDYRRLNVLTLEDPIEYHLTGISQMQVAQRKGMSFESGLRSVLRQDPDVIMVGEIRDAETARMAVQSALTGHLVLSTSHTNDAAGAVARLLDLGIEPFLLSESLLAAGAQRLIRKLCPVCRAESTLSAAEAARLGVAALESASAWRSVGCDACGGLGYFEREGLFEFLVVDDALRELIHGRAAAAVLRGSAMAAGMRTLLQEGLRKVRDGITTAEEVLRTAQ